MLNTYREITQPFIKDALFKNKTRVLALKLFYETRVLKMAYIVLSCGIYTTIKIYVCIDYLGFQWNFLSEIPVGSGGGSKHGYKRFDITLGIGITDLLMNLMSCHVLLNNINSDVILKCPKRILE